MSFDTIMSNIFTGAFVILCIVSCLGVFALICFAFYMVMGINALLVPPVLLLLWRIGYLFNKFNDWMKEEV